MSKPESHIAYCIRDPKGAMMINSTRYLRKDCISDYIGDRMPWAIWKKHGWTVEKVLVVSTKLPGTRKAKLLLPTHMAA